MISTSAAVLCLGSMLDAVPGRNHMLVHLPVCAPCPMDPMTVSTITVLCGDPVLTGLLHSGSVMGGQPRRFVQFLWGHSSGVWHSGPGLSLGG